MDLFDVNKDYTIGEWADIWFKNYAPFNLAEKTIKCYQDARNRIKKIEPGIENIKLTDLSFGFFQRAIDKLQSIAAKSSINHVRALYSNLYHYAITYLDYVDKNPAKGIKLPPKASVRVVNGLRNEEKITVEKYISSLSTEDEHIIRFFILSGLRSFEFRNLEWQNFNENEGILYVQKSKTKKGVRPLPVTPELFIILKYRKFLNQTRNSKYIFCRKDGKPTTTYKLRYLCRKIKKHTKVEHLTPHILRHTFATSMVEKGADYKGLSELMGHTQVSFTLQRYVKPDTNFLKSQMMLLSAQDIAK